MKILIIEDIDTNSKILSRMLKSIGTCAIASDGFIGLNFFKQAHSEGEPYELIFLDIMIPEMDGQEVLKGIRQFEKDNNIFGSDCVKVIMTTALDDSKNIMQAFRSQCEGYLVKPILQSKLFQEIDKVFNSSTC